MTPAERRGALRRQKRELRRALAQRQRAARARLEQDPRVQRARRQKRVRRTLAVLVLLLLACLLRCECEQPPPAEVTAPAPLEAKAVVPTPPAPKVEEPRLRMKKQPRAGFPEKAREAPSWLEDFRLQVAARSPRLAACFEGESRPGALRWTASVNAGSGGVSDHALEPVGTASAPVGKQRECVLQALSKPGYRLKGAQPQDLPTRVSLVLEF